MLTHNQLRAKALGRTEVKTQFDELSDEYALLSEFLKARAALVRRRGKAKNLAGRSSEHASLDTNF